MALHVFVAMPYGIKEGINFNKVYDDYIKAALEGVGFEVFRADKEIRAGNIRTDMFQELLLADFVVVDLSIDNPNVWYELGIRHALRARGVVQIQCKRDYMPFDVYVDRILRYHVKDGVPDADYLRADKEALANFATETMNSWHGRKISPVYQLLRYLQEPEWKKLRVDEAQEFWEVQEAWESRIEIARRKDRPGDIMVLAEEMPTRVLRLEAHRAAGKALVKLLQFSFALEQYEKALAIDPADVLSRQQKGIILGRLKKYDEAAVWLNELVKDHPDDPEIRGLLGRVKKDAWLESWKETGRTAEEKRKIAAEEDGLLREGIEPYATGFSLDCCHYYSGINALTLRHLLKHLTGTTENDKEISIMEGGVRWAVHSALHRAFQKNQKDYWAQVTLGDLEVLVSDENAIRRAYKDAVAIVKKDWFALDSSRQQLFILKDLGFRPPQVEAALSIFDHALGNLKTPSLTSQPPQVFLFSGHMIDAPGRGEPRFPADKEKIAAEAIARKLDEVGAGQGDLALCGGACGGDLLFAEACLKRGLHLEIRIPFDEPTFLKESVTFAGAGWKDRYYAVKNNSLTKVLMMPDELGPLPKNANAFERNNKWQLYSALAWGAEKVHFICLWNGKGGDGPGGTKHMIDEVQKRAGRVYILDTTFLW
jgi:tetratricopeptide (TPR) repeat protein